MSRIDFAFGSDHRLQMACQVVQRHYLAGHRVLVYTEDRRRLDYFDALLWRFEPSAFVPHVFENDPLIGATPIILTAQPPARVRAMLGTQWNPGTQDLWLLNLDVACPPGAEQFTRILEVVSTHEQDRAAARERWRLYKATGHEVRAHDMSKLRS